MHHRIVIFFKHFFFNSYKEELISQPIQFPQADDIRGEPDPILGKCSGSDLTGRGKEVFCKTICSPPISSPKEVFSVTDLKPISVITMYLKQILSHISLCLIRGFHCCEVFVVLQSPAPVQMIGNLETSHTESQSSLLSDKIYAKGHH